MIRSVVDLKERIPQLNKIKPNPNHYAIIDKWNRKVVMSCKHQVYEEIENEIAKLIEGNIVTKGLLEETFSQFADVSDYQYGDYHNFYIEYKPKLWCNLDVGAIVYLRKEG